MSSLPQQGVEVPLEHLPDVLHAALDRAIKPPRWSGAPLLPEVVRELGRWIRDDAQWRNGGKHHWLSLMDDLRAALEELPDEVLGWLPHTENLPAVERLRARLEGLPRKPALKERSRLELRSCVWSIERTLSSSDVMEVLWERLKSEPYLPARAERRWRELLALAAWSGWADARELADRLKQKLAPVLPAGQAAPSAAARCEAVEALLAEAAADRNYIVWLKVSHASLGVDSIAVGEHLRLFRADPLRDRLASGQRDDLPEAEWCRHGHDNDIKTCAGWFAKRPSDAADRSAEAEVLVRFEGKGRLQAVRREAERRVSTLAALRVLHDGHSSTWKLDDAYEAYVDGHSGGARYGELPPFTTPLQLLRVQRAPANDWLGESTSQIADILESGQPIDRDLCALLIWLAEAADSSPAPQVVLCDRVIETVTHWSALCDTDELMAKIVLPTWALSQLHEALAGIASAVRHSPERRGAPDSQTGRGMHEIWVHSGIKDQDADDGWLPEGLVQHFDFIEERTVTGSQLHRAVEALRPWALDSVTARAHIDELVTAGKNHEKRRRRTRNAFVHGGPQTAETAEQVAPFALYAARAAAGVAFRARLRPYTVDEQVSIDARAWRRVLEGLVPGAPVHEALFPERVPRPRAE